DRNNGDGTDKGRATAMEDIVLQGEAISTGMVMTGWMRDHGAESDFTLELGFIIITDVDGLLHIVGIVRFRVRRRWN
ncbi:hypothetical protein A2U01_0076743, partial [Trifolium medium]|nr:hypothetical protein [Trifolium medium]